MYIILNPILRKKEFVVGIAHAVAYGQMRTAKVLLYAIGKAPIILLVLFPYRH